MGEQGKRKRIIHPIWVRLGLNPRGKILKLPNTRHSLVFGNIIIFPLGLRFSYLTPKGVKDSIILPPFTGVSSVFPVLDLSVSP